MDIATGASVMSTRPVRGFTLVELAVVAALTTLLLAMGFSAVENLKERGNFPNAAGDLVAGLRRTRAEVFARGVETAFIVDTEGGRWWGIAVPGPFDLAAFNPTSPGTVIVNGALPAGVRFGPMGGYGQALPAPFAGVQVNPSTGDKFCSFCRTSGPNDGYGAVLFDSNGAARFVGISADAALRVGQQLTLSGSAGDTTRLMAVAIARTSGLIQTYER
jgi:hypothetical protein